MAETATAAEGISATETLRLLRGVARSGAHIANERDGSVSIWRAGPAGLTPVGEVAQGVWAGAVAEGLVAAEPGAGEWRLTRKGRSHLKRLLSRCGERSRRPQGPRPARPRPAPHRQRSRPGGRPR